MAKERGNKYLKWFDRYVGILVVALLSPFKWKRKLPQEIHSIALLKTAAIGDTVLLSGIIRDLQSHFPQVHLTVFTGGSNYELALMIPGIDVVKLPMTNPWKCLQIIRQYRFDMWIDFDAWPRINTLLSFFAKAQFKRGFNTPSEYRHYLYDSSILHLRTLHEIDNYRNLIRDLIPQVGCNPRVVLEENIQEDEKKVVLHLFPGGSQAALKKWDEGKWITLMHFLNRKGYKLYLTGGKGDYEENEAIIKKAKLPSAINTAGTLNLKETAYLLKTAFLVISVDTGIMHLAAALNCRVIGLHGPTSPKRWGAIGERVVALTPSMDYKPCIHLGFEKKCSHNYCMRALSIAQVQEAIEQFERQDASYTSLAKME